MSVAELEKVIQGGARENRFRVLFALPTGVTGNIKDISAIVTSTNVPGKTRGTINLMRDGLTHRIAGDKVSDETFPCSFKVPKEGKKIYTSMEQWFNLPDTSSDYKVKAKFQQLDTTNKVQSEWEISGMWISVLPPVTMNTESENTISQFEVTFTLDDVNLL